MKAAWSLTKARSRIKHWNAPLAFFLSPARLLSWVKQFWRRVADMFSSLEWKINRSRVSNRRINFGLKESRILRLWQSFRVLSVQPHAIALKVLGRHDGSSSLELILMQRGTQRRVHGQNELFISLSPVFDDSDVDRSAASSDDGLHDGGQVVRCGLRLAKPFFEILRQATFSRVGERAKGSRFIVPSSAPLKPVRCQDSLYTH